MPAIAMPGVSLPTYSHYFARVPGAPEQNIQLAGANVPGQSIPLSSSWPQGEAVNFGNQSASWPVGEVQTYGSPAIQPFSFPKGWRFGDWVCNCGFHNYSSRSQCKSCNASIPPAIGTKRLASEEIVHDSDSKRLNSGQTTGQQQTFPGFNQIAGATVDPTLGVYPTHPSISSGVAPHWQVTLPFPQQAVIPTLVGKGAKQWRGGDWMCTNCNNHNYASRAQCNRCKTPRDGSTQPVNT